MIVAGGGRLLAAVFLFAFFLLSNGEPEAKKNKKRKGNGRNRSTRTRRSMAAAFVSTLSKTGHRKRNQSSQIEAIEESWCDLLPRAGENRWLSMIRDPSPEQQQLRSWTFWRFQSDSAIHQIKEASRGFIGFVSLFVGSSINWVSPRFTWFYGVSPVCTEFLLGFIGILQFSWTSLVFTALKRISISFN